MKTHVIPLKNRRKGYSLLMVVTLSGISMLVLAAALTWTMTNTTLNERSNQYYNTLAAAEAASEKILAYMAKDYQEQGEARVWANRTAYHSRVPTSSECALWGDFEFTDAQGSAGTYVARLANASFVPLDSQYQGLYGLASTYRVVSNARMPNGQYDIRVGLKQDLQLASIPVFQFAIFYSVDLEINPGPNMTVTGRVHGNKNLYMQPQATLSFLSDVTAAGSAIKDKSPLDPTIRSTNSSQWLFAINPESGRSALTLPIGTNNSPDSVHAILEVPPDGESANSAVGKQRYYNKADVVILVSNSSVTVKSGLVNAFGTAIPAFEYDAFLITTNSFYDWREAKTIKTTEIDVAKFKEWSETNTSVRPLLGDLDTSSIYVADLRTNASTSIQYGVKVKNGKILPDLGLTVATPNPLYVQGHFNAPDAVLNINSTVGTKPASLVGDSINVLSTAWQDANSLLTVANRVAANTTVNAAFLAGIVPSNGTTYSGGVENFPRFLERWTGKTLTYNGSMVVMFHSKTATRPWGSANVYNPPIRQWAFDLNFLDAAKLPPGTPAVRALIRGEWTTVKTGYVTGI